MAKKLNKELFIQKATEKHSGKFDYSLVEYVDYNTSIVVICPIHGPFDTIPRTHLLSYHNCKPCGLEYKKQQTLLQYGVAHPSQLATVQERRRQTNLERYGVDSPQKNNTIKAKTKQTNIERYGHEYTTQVSGFQTKKRHSFLERYGVDNPMKEVKTRNKQKQTMVRVYGVEYPQQNIEIQNKTAETNLTKYGNKCSIGLRQSEFVGNRMQTNVDRYGVEHFTQRHMVDCLPLIKDYDWLFDQYIRQGKTAIQIASELEINGTTVGNYLKASEIQIKQQFWSSYKCQLWLQQQDVEIIPEWNIPGTRLRADGYCETTNTIYEFYGDYWHGNPTVYQPDEINEVNKKCMGNLYENTIQRENLITSLGYNLIVMWECNWNTLFKDLIC